MKSVTLSNTSPLGLPLQATFLPEGGMNLISYKLGDIEVIDQATRPLFDERFAGLGALIGPHFHHRKEIPHDFDEALFPHIATIKAQGKNEPFSHGIARYVPWKYAASNTQIQARLTGSDLYKGVSLKTFEGQDFLMTFDVQLLTDGLFITLKIDSEKPSLVGLHYYYALSGPGFIHGFVQNTYRDQEMIKPIPDKWLKNHHLHFSLPQKADFGFFPQKKTPNDHDYHLNLNTPDYSLHIDYNTTSNTEISCQVFHPQGASYVCVEPLSAKIPPNPVLTRSALEAKLQIFSPQTYRL
ncbi:MAG: hypothetical protein KDK76_03375 [Chlamydiia bacterium]|nr:hypothetical protein [Chlamydiia bacterium]